MISRLPTFLICLLLAGSVYSQDTREAEDTRDIDVTELIETVLRLGHIELPFEFYNGRWAEGHLGTYSNVYSDGLRPSPRFDYSYSSSGWNFSAEGFQGDIVTGDDDVNVSLPTISMYVRPIGNMQIGIYKLTYDSYSREKLTPYFPSNSYSSSGDSFAGSGSVVWQSHPSFSISAQDAAYHYLVRRLVGTGNVRATANYTRTVRQEAVESIYSNTNNPGVMTSGGNARHSSTSLRLGTQWGFVEGFEARAIVNMNWNDQERTSSSSSNELNRDDAFHWQKRSYETLLVDYDISVLTNRLSPVWISGSIDQSFSEGSGNYYEISGTDSVEHHVSDSSSSDFGVARTEIGLGATIVSQGEFNPAIVLDDYSGYYRGMPFKGQVVASAFLRHVDYAGHYNDVLNSNLIVPVVYGLTNNFALSSSLERSWRRMDRGDGQEYWGTWSLVLGGQYRSYEFREGSGPGWERDSRFDVPYQPVLPQGHFYFEAMYWFPSLYQQSTESFGLLSFSDLSNSHVSRAEVELALGLGYGLEFLVRNQDQYESLSVTYRYTSIGLSGRVFERGKVTVEWFDTRHLSNYPRRMSARESSSVAMSLSLLI